MFHSVRFFSTRAVGRFLYTPNWPSSLKPLYPRRFSTDNALKVEPGKASQSENLIKVNYITKNGDKIVVYGKEGDSIMHLAQQNGIDIEGACEASLACCTCHCYIKDDYFKKLSAPSEQEEDMLDMAPFLKTNSRLTCQLILTQELNDIEVTLPPATRNFYVDGTKPSHH